MDGETPSWLAGDSGPTPAPAETPPPSSDKVPTSFPLETPPPPSSKTSSSAPVDNIAGSILASGAADANTLGDENELPKVILLMRLLNMAAAGTLIGCSVVELVALPHISVWIMAIYASCGGLLVCCLETQLKFIRTIIAMNFGFLFNSVYRAIFYCLMASVCWGYRSVFGKITAIILVVVAVFNTFVICRYPSYRKMREKIAAEEDKRIEAKINQQIKRQAVNHFTG